MQHFVHHSAYNSIRMNAHENRILFNNEKRLEQHLLLLLFFFIYIYSIHGMRWRSREEKEEDFSTFSLIVRIEM